MSLFLYAQTQCEPFLIQAGNKMESILLSCVIIIFALLAIPVDDDFKEYVISFLIMIPFILFIYFIIDDARSRLQKKKQNVEKILVNEENGSYQSMRNTISISDQLIVKDEYEPKAEVELVKNSEHRKRFMTSHL